MLNPATEANECHWNPARAFGIEELLLVEIDSVLDFFLRGDRPWTFRFRDDERFIIKR
jgi:hypothetical protein